ncbi:hypothetical protein [Amycolatopsis sp. lyj-90]|uniref:hypothetical protein n=1 Tax=Amycolatopsis sp. lyj-90 TaxID=2789285 RepID=UPI003979DF8D
MPRTRLVATVVTAFAVTTVALGAAAFAAPATPPSTQPQLAAPAEDVPPHSVEDFVHPDAERLKAERGITLRKGNGGIRLVDCGPDDQIRLYSSEVSDELCFKVTLPVPAPGVMPAYLALELPDVYLIRSNNQTTTAKVTSGGKTAEHNLAKDQWTSIGSGVPGGTPATLLELRVTP